MTWHSGERQIIESMLADAGYGPEYLRRQVFPPTARESLEAVAFTRTVPQDIRTSAVALSSNLPVSVALELARRMATPAALVREGHFADLYFVSARPRDDRRIDSFESPSDLKDRGVTFVRSLEPGSIERSKSGGFQSTLFPVDVRLLESARRHSIESIEHRLETEFVRLNSLLKRQPVEVAELVVSSLAAVITADKYGDVGSPARAKLATSCERHPGYFRVLQQWAESDPDMVVELVDHLSRDLDYSSIDARSINSVYERLFVTPELRREQGIFYTDPQFAAKIVQNVPFEELAPEARVVLDPSCGSGNLLLATQERLEALSPRDWSASKTHEWLRSHLSGYDVDPIACEIARLSLLVSSLPVGNTWRIERRDALQASRPSGSTPTVIVTNPPWRNRRGSRRDIATEFLLRSVEMLDEGGFLACILPVTWLTAAEHSKSRQYLRENADIFEVWRLPRDMFGTQTRVGCAVVFARKASSNRWASAPIAFRWVNAGSGSRERFLLRGVASYSGIIRRYDATAGVVAGPADAMSRRSDALQVVDVAKVVSGAVQKGDLSRVGADEAEFKVLARGTAPKIYGELGSDILTPAGNLDHLLLTSERARMLSTQAVKLLVQADRFPDNPWRVRPVVDRLGSIPVGLWQILISDADTLYALHALFASRAVNCWVHARVAGKRISTEILKSVPLPPGWGEVARNFAELGQWLLSGESTHECLIAIDEAAYAVYGFSEDERMALDEFMRGYRAPEGDGRGAASEWRELEDEGSAPRDTSEESLLQPGSVLGVTEGGLEVWLPSMEESVMVPQLPAKMPGWLAREGSVFEISGDVLHGDYRLLSHAYLSDDELSSWVAGQMS